MCVFFLPCNKSDLPEHHHKYDCNQGPQQAFFSLMPSHFPLNYRAVFVVYSKPVSTGCNPLLLLCPPRRLPQRRPPSHRQPFVITPGPCCALILWKPASSSCNSISPVYYLHPNKSLGVFPSLREANVPGMWKLMPKKKPRSGVKTSTVHFMRKRLTVPPRQQRGWHTEPQGTSCFLPPSFTPPKCEVQ